MQVSGLTAECMACKEQFTPTREQLQEARDYGALFSVCCNAVSTVVEIEATSDTAV